MADQPRDESIAGRLKTGVETLSGLSLDGMRVHRNSSEPAAFPDSSTTVHLAPDQALHLPHEAWHVVQRRRGIAAAAQAQSDDTSINEEAALEQEADRLGAQAARGHD